MKREQKKKQNKLTTLDIEIAMMNYLNIRQNMIVPNVHWGMVVGGKQLHECDLLSLTKSGYATEIEIKVTKADLLKDKEKMHGHNHNGIANFFYAVPENLKDIALESIPTRAGLYVVHRSKWVEGRYNVDIVKGSKRISGAIKWSDKERANLARLGVMRILGLKTKIKNLQNKIKK